MAFFEGLLISLSWRGTPLKFLAVIGMLRWIEKDLLEGKKKLAKARLNSFLKLLTGKNQDFLVSYSRELRRQNKFSEKINSNAVVTIKKFGGLNRFQSWISYRRASF